MNFELSHDRRNISDEMLLADLRRVQDEYCSSVFSQRLYKEHGTFGVSTIIRRFGLWNGAVAKAGLSTAHVRNISNNDLFSALYELWIKLGRQPKYSEIVKSNCGFSAKPYEQRFGSWRGALEAFVLYINSEGVDAPIPSIADGEKSFRRTPRTINLRLRFRILQRDNFRCCICGATPALTPGTILNIDHIMPWSRGGETHAENLQTLCFSCNQGKSND